jgi:hypothetical protein
MKFRVGQSVAVRKNLGQRRDRSSDEYYFGGHTYEVPIFTRGTIREISSRQISVKTSNGYDWMFHPDELGLPLEKRTVDFLKGLPEHPLLEMVKDNPAIVVDEKLYLVQGKPSGENVATLGRKEYGLSDPILLSSLDDLFFQRTESELEGWRDRYAKEILENIETPITNDTSDIPQRIYSEVFPYFRNNKQEKIAAVLGEQRATEVDKQKALPKKSKIDRTEMVESASVRMMKEITELRRDLYTPQPQPIVEPRSKRRAYLDNILSDEIEISPYHPTTIIGKAIGQRAVLFQKGRVFSGEKMVALEQVKNVDNRTKGPFIVDGRGYRVGAELSRENLSRDLAKLLLERQVSETFDVNLSKDNLRRTIEKKVAGLPDFTGLTEYEEGEVGFIKSADTWYVTLRVPKFAIKSPHDGRYYRFDSFRVRVPFDNPIDIYTVEDISHPFVSSGKQVCIGNNIFPSGSSMGETIAKTLLLAREILMSGYKKKNIRPYRLLASGYYDGNHMPYFDKNITSLSQLKKEGIPIFGGDSDD